MRTVVKSGEVYHLWAHQSQSHARCGNQSFRETDAYSYNAVIASLVKVKGEWVALHTTQRWSVTTSAHQSECRMATSHLTSFTVPSLTPNHKENLAYFKCAIEEAANKAARARTQWPVDALAGIVADANRYAETFGLATRFVAPALDRKALKERIARKAAADAAIDVKRKRERERQQEELRREFEAKLGAWLAGEDVRLPYSTRGNAYLRIEDDEAVTTQGARVPLEHIRKVKPVVLALIEAGRTYERNGHTIHLGHYALDSIDAEGTVRAGCHKFAKAEVLRFLALVGDARKMEVSE